MKIKDKYRSLLEDFDDGNHLLLMYHNRNYIFILMSCLCRG